MKYIGPFLRINSLKKENIENQLLHLSKESLKYIVLNSRCGITIPMNQLKLKNISNIDINTITSFSPLLCIYKKADPSLININNRLCFDEDAVKKEVNIESNALMTLALLELIDYYATFKDVDPKKHFLSNLYFNLTRHQLEFFATHLRNEEGVFIDKKDISDSLHKELKFEDKSKKFKYSDQALLMAAYYNYSNFDTEKIGEEYKNFALDILKMFIEFKDELYNCSFEELNKLCLGLNLFYKYSKLQEAKVLLLDLSEFLLENYKDINSKTTDDELQNYCLVYINTSLLYENTKILKFKDYSKDIYNKLAGMYNPELRIFIRSLDKKETVYTCDELTLYLLSMILDSKTNIDSSDDSGFITDIFKRQIVDSGLILSWPNSPDLNDVERYRGYSSKSEDLIDEQNFRMSTVPTPEISALAPVFNKSVTYNRKKESFNIGKVSFDSNKNMLIFFLTIYFSKIFKDVETSEA